MKRDPEIAMALFILSMLMAKDASTPFAQAGWVLSSVAWLVVTLLRVIFGTK